MLRPCGGTSFLVLRSSSPAPEEADPDPGSGGDEKKMGATMETLSHSCSIEAQERAAAEEKLPLVLGYREESLPRNHKTVSRGEPLSQPVPLNFITNGSFVGEQSGRSAKSGASSSSSRQSSSAAETGTAADVGLPAVGSAASRRSNNDRSKKTVGQATQPASSSSVSSSSSSSAAIIQDVAASSFAAAEIFVGGLEPEELEEAAVTTPGGGATPGGDWVPLERAVGGTISTTLITTNVKWADDLRGSWICQEGQGDFDGLLEALGVPKPRRQAASAVNYGFGRQRLHLELGPGRNELKIITGLGGTKGPFATVSCKVDGPPTRQVTHEVLARSEPGSDVLSITFTPFSNMLSHDHLGDISSSVVAQALRTRRWLDKNTGHMIVEASCAVPSKWSSNGIEVLVDDPTVRRIYKRLKSS